MKDAWLAPAVLVLGFVAGLVTALLMLKHYLSVDCLYEAFRKALEQ